MTNNKKIEQLEEILPQTEQQIKQTREAIMKSKNQLPRQRQRIQQDTDYKAIVGPRRLVRVLLVLLHWVLQDAGDSEGSQCLFRIFLELLQDYEGKHGGSGTELDKLQRDKRPRPGEQSEKFLDLMENPKKKHAKVAACGRKDGDAPWLDQLLSCITQRDESQRDNIFLSMCLVKQTVCNLMIDSGSNRNFVSKTLVQHLKLETAPIPSYPICWMKEGHLGLVTETCRIPLSIGKLYKDDVECDVTDIDLCDIILGRPWQYDMDAIFLGRQNVYLIRWKKKRVILCPSSKDNSSNQHLEALVKP